MDINNILSYFVPIVPSAVAALITYPGDVCKTQYQVAKENYNKPMTSPQIIKNIYKTQGVHGFYKGLGFHMATYPMFWTLFWTCESYTKRNDIVFSSNKYFNRGILTIISSSVGTIASNPFYFLKLRRQNEILSLRSNEKPRNTFLLIRSIIKEEGYRAFYKGLGITLVSNFKFMAQFPFYDWLKDEMEKMKFNNTTSTFWSSILSKVFISSLFYPVDLIRDRQRDKKTSQSAIRMINHIFKTNGIRGLYHGVTIYTLYSTPNFVIMMLVRDFLINNEYL